MTEIFLKKLAEVFNGNLEIERITRTELAKQKDITNLKSEFTPLAKPFQKVMQSKEAHPICSDILKLPFSWAPPETSSDELYKEHSLFKSHIELLGPDGLIKSDLVRLGLYGMLPNSEYGIRTHPAEEIYIMLAGDCLWKKGDHKYQSLTVGEKSHHPSFLPHASKTEANAFMSVYVWYGDLSNDSYSYQGLPED